MCGARDSVGHFYVPRRFWHYQFARNGEVCRYLLKYIPAPGGTGISASGGTWMIRAGKHITLAALLWFAHEACSCFDLYRA